MRRTKGGKPRIVNAGRSSVEAGLRRELRRLQRKYALGLELRDVRWAPGDGGFSGEVKDGVVYVYDRDPGRAVRTLRHEVLDYHLTERIIRKPIGLLNLILKGIEEEIFQEKERLVERLAELLR